MDWLLERTVGSGILSHLLCTHFFYLNFTNDVALLAELLELLIAVLETMASEAASLGLEVNW